MLICISFILGAKQCLWLSWRFLSSTSTSKKNCLYISIPFLLGCLTLFLTVLAICITYLLARSKATASIYFFRFYVFYKLTKLFISFFQVVKMFVTVMVIFATCWCPYHLYFLLSYYFPDIQKQPYTRLVDQSKKSTT